MGNKWANMLITDFHAIILVVYCLFRLKEMEAPSSWKETHSGSQKIAVKMELSILFCSVSTANPGQPLF